MGAPAPGPKPAPSARPAEEPVEDEEEEPTEERDPRTTVLIVALAVVGLAAVLLVLFVLLA
jgi:hypothetical protein